MSQPHDNKNNQSTTDLKEQQATQVARSIEFVWEHLHAVEKATSRLRIMLRELDKEVDELLNTDINNKHLIHRHEELPKCPATTKPPQ